MAKKRKGPTIQDLQKEIRFDFKRWNQLYKHGGVDPFYTDGSNLSLVRDHVIIDQARLRELCKAQVRPCPIEATLKLPKEVSDKYCAPRSKAGPCRERRAAARKTQKKSKSKSKSKL